MHIFSLGIYTEPNNNIDRLGIDVYNIDQLGIDVYNILLPEQNNQTRKQWSRSSHSVVCHGFRLNDYDFK